MTTFRKIYSSLLLGVALLVGSRVPAAELHIAAASDLKFALDEIVKQFKKHQPATAIKVTYGSSGNFYAQLKNQAPFDLYFSADILYPRKISQAGLALDTDVFFYAIGRLAIWAPTRSSFDVEALGIEALAAPTIKKIAIANPRHAPYGAAAVAAMKTLKVYDRVEPKLVYGENIAQAAQFVQSGAADIGIIALSLALNPPMRDTGSYWELPSDAYPKMEQGGVILKWTKEPHAARAFRDFVLSNPGRGVFKRHGFSLPEIAKP